MKIFKKIALAAALVALTATMTSCIKPYDTPEFVTIEASQTAFLIPLIGDTTEQASFQSEELLAQAMVATKEVQIPHRWVQTGRWDWVGEYRPTMKLIVVDRTPETREWSSTKGVGTSSADQAIYAESSESIGFSVGVNCSAQIYSEQDAVKFLYSYNNKTLSEIMDNEIRARVESKFNEESGRIPINNILLDKTAIMDAVRDDVIPYFAEKGITITVLGYKDGIEYDDAAIQDAINDKFASEQLLITQENNNKVIISKAEAEAQAKLIAAEAEAEANKKISESLTTELLEQMKYEKWDGTLPRVTGSGNESLIIGLD